MIASNLQIQLAALTTAAPTRNSCAIAQRFGLDLESAQRRAQSVDVPLERGRVTLVEGASGAGKSMLLRAVIEQAMGEGVAVVDPGAKRLRNRPAIDLVRGDSPEHAARLLAQAGLSDARVFVTRERDLSAGERARVRLAMALREIEKTDGAALLVIDDFAQDLDLHSARAVSALLARCLRGSNTSAIVATTRLGLAHPLDAAHRVTVNLSGHILTSETAHEERWAPAYVMQRRVSPSHWQRLAWAHHRAGDPACVTERIAAVDPETNETRGVLLIAMPTLNARWRSIAFDGRFDFYDKRDAARAVNRDLRRIARVVVDPRFRGLGIAAALVRAYLDAPQSCCTEALAAMGAFSGFFERAGMRATALPPAPADARLLDALAHAGVERWRLATPTSALVRARRSMGERFLKRELSMWAVGARAACKRSDVDAMFRAACATITSEMTVFTHCAHGEGRH